MSIQDFEGWYSHEINLSDGEKIICYYFRSDKKNVSLHDCSHNIFRLDKDGNVVWQVKREELHPEWWAMAHRKAARGNEDMQRKIRDPFARLSTCYFKRGIYNEFEETPAKYRSDTWQADYVLLAWVYGRGVYELDIDKGIAKEVTQPGGRDW